ncbi:MAG: hypothetical protein WD928_13945 [Gammaproteobacteria bacterium]
MTVGEEIGVFEGTATSVTQTVDASARRIFAMNFEGPVSGRWEGAHLTTLIAKPHTEDYTSGTFSAPLSYYLKDGGVVSGVLNGVFATKGRHSWQLNGIARLSDATRVAVELSLELESRSIAGVVFEIT